MKKYIYQWLQFTELGVTVSPALVTLRISRV